MQGEMNNEDNHNFVYSDKIFKYAYKNDDDD